MAAYFIDLDGTIFEFGTNKFLPNALENLIALRKAGHQLIFTTLRRDAADVREILVKAGIDSLILTNIDSPRIVINDDGAYAINHQRNMPWNPA